MDKAVLFSVLNHMDQFIKKFPSELFSGRPELWLRRPARRPETQLNIQFSSLTTTETVVLNAEASELMIWLDKQTV